MPTFETDRGGLLWDATAVSNAFLCEYMPAAPDGHVKVYLYGLMCAHGGTAEEGDLLEDAARALALSRDDVERAMRYWERCCLVERVQDTPPRYRYLSVQQALMRRQSAPRDDAYEDFAQALYAAFGERRKLHGGETVLAYEWVEQLKLPPEVVLMLIQHMIGTRGVNFSFKSAQKLAVELSEQHVFTIEDAEAVFNRSEAAMKGARKILRHLGMRRNPTMDEIDLYQKWTEQWGFEPDAVVSACGETTKGSPNFAYLDKVLEGIRSRNSGERITRGQVGQQLKDDHSETARIREVLGELGISMSNVGAGVRSVYREMESACGHEVVALAAREVARSRRAHTLDNVSALLGSWSKKGLADAQSVQAYLDEVGALNTRLRAIGETVGASVGVNDRNRQLLRCWRDEWQMSDALIDLAAEFARNVDMPLLYMNKLLEGWHTAGVADEEAARAEHERHQAEAQKHAAPAVPAAPKRVIEQQYEQRTYDPDEFEDLSPAQIEEMNRQ